jgi:hypothetical protein
MAGPVSAPAAHHPVVPGDDRTVPRHPVHSRRPAPQRRTGLVDQRHLRVHHGRLPGHLRHPRRPPGTPQAPARRCRALRRGLRALGLRAEPGTAHRRPGADGPRRGGDHARHALPDHQHVRRRTPEGRRDRTVGLGDLRRRRPRPARRRPPPGDPVVGRGAAHRRPGHGPGLGDRAVPGARVPRPERRTRRPAQRRLLPGHPAAVHLRRQAPRRSRHRRHLGRDPGRRHRLRHRFRPAPAAPGGAAARRAAVQQPDLLRGARHVPALRGRPRRRVPAVHPVPAARRRPVAARRSRRSSPARCARRTSSPADSSCPLWATS